ncbi:MAG: HU family DNA-binding protein, partial [Bacteroidota bacterium]|nr:HU family DNA-binding protein [Bacteroidota bacterium]
MDIAGYIKEFLLLQNNVRVPELGSFLITNQSAIIDEAKKTITPPSKAVLFDENGKTVDQPFLKFLSGKEGITEEDALKSLSEFTTEVKAKLQSDGFITFPGFGKFSYDNNRQIQFEPFFTEFLSAEIYGLDTLTGITPLKEP